MPGNSCDSSSRFLNSSSVRSGAMDLFSIKFDCFWVIILLPDQHLLDQVVVAESRRST